MHRHPIPAVCCFFIAGLCTASEPGMVVPVDGEPFLAHLISVDGNQVSVRAERDNASTVSFSASDLVRWSHPAEPRPQPQVLLADGTLLVAADDWSGRGSLELNEETLKVVTTGFDEVALPRRLVVAALLVPPHDRLRRQRLVDELRRYDGKTDKFWLAGGDQVAGTVARLDDGKWIVTTEAGEVALPVASVEAVAFNSQLVDHANVDGLSWMVGCQDGSLLVARSLQANAESLRITTGASVELAGPAVDEIVFLQVVGSPNLVYLSDLEPADFRHVPYLDLQWPWQPDRNLMGGRLRSAGAEYFKGLAMHSASRLTFALDGTYRELAARIALDDAAKGRGSVVFRVFVARDQQWHEAFASEVVRGGDAPQAISVDIAGGQAITLIVDYADRGDELDHANWLEARLVK